MIIGVLARSFDLLNVQDLDLIRQARSLCTRLTLAVLSDAMVEALSGRAPVVPLVERMALVEHIRIADEVISFDGSDPALLSDGATLFAVAGDPLPVNEAASIVTITPRRQSSSLLLRQALVAHDKTSVA